MLIQAFLRRLVVVRRHGENAVDAHVLQFLRQLDHFGGVVAARAGQHRNLALGFFERDLDHAQMFARASASGLSPVVPQGTRKLMPASIWRCTRRRKRRFVERQILAERSDQRGAASCEHTCHLFENKTSLNS